jgi:hypothetical protein
VSENGTCHSWVYIPYGEGDSCVPCSYPTHVDFSCYYKLKENHYITLCHVISYQILSNMWTCLKSIIHFRSCYCFQLHLYFYTSRSYSLFQLCLYFHTSRHPCFQNQNPPPLPPHLSSRLLVRRKVGDGNRLLRRLMIDVCPRRYRRGQVHVGSTAPPNLRREDN